MFRFALFLSLAALVFLSGCASPKYHYEPVAGMTGVVRQGYAFPPADAPPEVRAAIDAGNRISGMPYRRGGGHRVLDDTAYDCSGAVSYVLRGAGLLGGAMPSKGFRNYGEPGEGKWISIYAQKGHVFIVVAGLRFDTGWTRSPEGPRWSTLDRPAKGAVIRHPRGL